MATLDLAAFSAVLNILYSERATEQFRKDMLLGNLLRIKPGSGGVCDWTAKFFERTSAGPRNEGHDAVAGDFTHHDRVPASLPWAQYFGYAAVTGLAQAIAASNGQGAISEDILSEEVGDSLTELSLKIGSHLYSGAAGASPIEFVGLATAVDSTGVYAGIDQGVRAAWASGENTLALGSISKDNLRTKLHRPFKDATGKYPEFVVCPGNIWDNVIAIFEDQVRYLKEIETVARGTVNLKMAGGARAVEIDGVPYLEDRHCTASTLYALHSEWLEIEQLPSANSAMDPTVVLPMLKTLTGIEMAEDEMAELMRATEGMLTPTIEAIGKTGDNTKIQAKVYAQLKLKRRQAASKLVIT